MLGIVSGLRFQTTDVDFQRRLRKIWQQDADHFGIKSIQQRILLYYGPGYGLSMESPQTGGCITVITLPKQEGLHVIETIDCR